MHPREINAPPTLNQLYAMLGEALAENHILKTIIAAHPEVIAATAVTGPMLLPADAGASPSESPPAESPAEPPRKLRQEGA